MAAKRRPVKLSAKAKRLLERVAKHVEQDYRRLDMREWGYRADRDLPPEEAPACNTIGCIGGWTVILSDPKRLLTSNAAFKNAMRGAEMKASRLLGLSTRYMDTEGMYDGPSEHERLFMVDDWPERYQRNWEKLSPRNKARRTAARIRYFIKHGR